MHFSIKNTPSERKLIYEDSTKTVWTGNILWQQKPSSIDLISIYSKKYDEILKQKSRWSTNCRTFLMRYVCLSCTRQFNEDD